MPHDQHDVFILDHNSSAVRLLIRQLDQYGVTYIHYSDSTQLISALKTKVPYCVILGDYASMSDYAGIVAAIPPSAMLIFARENALVTDRLIATRYNCSAFYQKPVDPVHLVNHIEQQRLVQTKPFTALFVGVEEKRSVYLCKNLLQNGVKIVRLEEPLRILDTLRDDNIDLIVLEHKLGQCSGIEMATMLRQHPQWAWIPIIMLTDSSDLSLRSRIAQWGPITVFPKYISPDQLSTLILAEIQRVRTQAIAMTSDPLTGLQDHMSIRRLLSATIDQVQGTDTPVSWAVLETDCFEDITKKYGKALGDDIITALAKLVSESTGPNQIAGRVYGKKLAIIMHNQDEQSAIEFMNQLRTKWSDIHHDLPRGETLCCTLSVGVSQHKPEMSIADVLKQADKYLDDAERNGRNCVISTNYGRKNQH